MELGELQNRFNSLVGLLKEADKAAGDEDEGRWVTMHGAKVFINKKGKAIKGPEGATDSVNKTDSEKAKDNVDKILGDNEFQTKEGEDGKPVISHPEVKDEEGNEVEVEMDGPKMADVLASLMTWMDVARALAIKGAGALGRNIEKLVGQVKDAVDEWQSSEK